MSSIKLQALQLNRQLLVESVDCPILLNPTLLQKQLIDDMDIARINEHRSAPKQMSTLLDILLDPFRRNYEDYDAVYDTLLIALKDNYLHLVKQIGASAIKIKQERMELKMTKTTGPASEHSTKMVRLFDKIENRVIVLFYQKNSDIKFLLV